MTDKGMRQYRREIETETDPRNLRYLRRFWMAEAGRMHGDKYRQQCTELATMATNRLLDLTEYHGEGTA